MVFISRIILFVAGCFVTTLASAVDAQFFDKNYPGGIALVKLANQPTEPPTFNNRPLRYFSDSQQQWYAVAGIPLDAKNHISVSSNDVVYKIQIIDRQYPEQRIVIKDKSKVTPGTSNMGRIRSEFQKMLPVYKSYTGLINPTDTSELSLMRWPVNGPISSQFGLKRFFNDKPRRPHSGLDIAAPEGTPVIAPAAGKVVLTGDFFFNGKSVFIDHGQGMISMMCHLSTISVSDNQMLEAGTEIGEVGKTGRATGPHLHWTVSLNDQRVDPLIFLPARPAAKVITN